MPKPIEKCMNPTIKDPKTKDIDLGTPLIFINSVHLLNY